MPAMTRYAGLLPANNEPFFEIEDASVERFLYLKTFNLIPYGGMRWATSLKI